MVEIDGGSVTRFTYIEYQALTMLIAVAMILGLVLIEIVTTRRQVLPVFFPAMFSVHDRRLFFFDCDVTHGAGRRIQSYAKMVLRLTLCSVLSYLWQHCVVETMQQVGNEFPSSQCDDGYDCFSSDLHISTLVTHQHSAVDCSGPRNDFATRTVVTCVRFISPSAPRWLMHMGIAHSVTLLNFKAFELLVWLAGSSRVFRRCLATVFVTFLVLLIALFFGGLMTTFIASWLSFVMSLTLPLFIFCVLRSGKGLEVLWYLESKRLQESITSHLDTAFKDIEVTIPGQLESLSSTTTPGTGEESGKEVPASKPMSLLKSTIAKLPSRITRRHFHQDSNYSDIFATQQAIIGQRCNLSLNVDDTLENATSTSRETERVEMV